MEEMGAFQKIMAFIMTGFIVMFFQGVVFFYHKDRKLVGFTEMEEVKILEKMNNPECFKMVVNIKSIILV